MKEPKIKTYTTEAFRNKFIKPEQHLDLILKPDFGRFFLVRVEDMIRLMKLPVPPTRATTHTLMFLTEGFAEMTIGSASYTFYKDECLLVPAGQVFAIGNVDVNSAKGYLCNFHNDIAAGKMLKPDALKDFEFLEVWGNHQVKLEPGIAQFVQVLFERLLLDYSENGLKNIDLIQSCFFALLCELNGAYQPLSMSVQVQAVTLSNRFKALLYERIKTTHLVADYAALLNITPNHLNKVVKQITGKSPTKWIDETLVLEAKVLLYQTNASINEIAASLGIFDPSYFSRVFKKYEGQSPLAFRKKIEKSGRQPIIS